MSRRKTPKAKTLRILDAATLTYRMVYLFNVTFQTLTVKGTDVVQVYAPSLAEVLPIANKLYAGQGIFVKAVGAYQEV